MAEVKENIIDHLVSGIRNLGRVPGFRRALLVAGCWVLGVSVWGQLSCIVAQTNPVTCYGGNDGVATVTASGGSGSYEYKWSPSGGTSTTATGLTAGPYTVTVTDGIGSTTCDVTITEPSQPLTISDQPLPQTDCYGNTVEFHVAVGGNIGTPSYQWQQMPPSGSYTDILGATSSSLSLSNIGVNGLNVDGTLYRVVVTDACQTITSNGALLNINSITTLTGSEDLTICDGGNTTYQVSTHGSVVSYHWSFQNGTGWVDLTDGGAYTGTASPQLTISPAHSAQSGLYRVSVIFNTLNQAAGRDTCIETSFSRRRNLLVLNPLSPPVVSASQSICYNNLPVQLTATSASGGSGSFSYQWQSSPDGTTSWTDINLATGLTYSPPTLTSTTYYRIIATDVGTPSCGSVNSAAVEILVDPTSVGGTVNGGTSVCSGTNSTLLTLSGYTGDIVSWESSTNGGANWNPIANTTDTYTATNLTLTTEYRAVIQSGVCPQAFSSVATITVNPLLPVSVSVTVSSATICAGTSVTFTATPINEGSAPAYQWKLNGINTGTNSNTYTSATLNNNDKITVDLTSSATCANPGTPVTSNTITMTVNPLLVPSVTITESNNNICPGTPVSFNALSFNGGTAPTYEWKLNGDVVGGNSEIYSSSTLTNGDNISVIVTSNATCASPQTAGSNVITINVKPGIPVRPGSITGTIQVCPNITGLVYSISPVQNADSYSWTLPSGWILTNGQGTTSITVTSGNSGQNGNVSVTASNSCGTSLSSNLAVTVRPGTPSTPGTIIPPPLVCPGITNLIYSIASVPTADSYSWNVPAGWTITGGQGTTSITVTSGSFGQNGNITVTATNPCGTSSPSMLAVNVNHGPPVTPGPISGPTNMCPGVAGLSYSIAGVQDATSYTWTVPSGWSITGGQGSTTITVTSGIFGQNGNITVSAGNSCGTSPASSLAVNLNPGTPSIPGPITAPVLVCPNSSGLSYSISTVQNASNYTWTVPTGWSITGGQGTTTISVTSGNFGQNGNISVTAGNSCGTSPAKSQAVTVNPGTPNTPGTINGTTEQCINKAGLVYSIASVQYANSYNWTVPSGWTITSGAGTNIITTSTTAGAVSGIISVTATNLCGTSASSFISVNISTAIPSSPDIPSGPTSICPPALGMIYSVPAVPNATNYIWNLPVGFTITAGTGTNIITVTAESTLAYADYNISVSASNACGVSPSGTPLVVTVGSYPTVTIIPDQQTICNNTSNISLSATIGGAARKNKGTWTTGGSGTFTPATKPNTNYTPSAADRAAGTVILTFTTEDPAGSCTAATANFILTIRGTATASISGNTTICSGSSANIIFTATPNTTVTYTINGGTNQTISINGTGTATLNTGALITPTTYSLVSVAYTTNPFCSQSVSGSATVAINPAANANAGPDQIICAGSTATLAGSVGGSATSGTWSGGTGSFSPNTSTLNAIYTPGASDITAGTVTLTLTTNDPTGPCNAATDQLVITINPQPTVNAGADQTICAGSTASLAGSVGGSATSGIWSGGTGSFSPSSSTLNAIYTPGASDITAGTITLTLTTNDPAGPCNAASDQIVITINPQPLVNAGTDQTICAGATSTLAGSVGGSATSGIWSGGTGSFSPNSSTLNAVYTPGASDITAGTVTLTLTTNDPAGPCNAVSDQLVIIINPQPLVNAGADQTICAGASATLAGSVGGSATSGTWSGGTGTFSPNSNTLNATYTPSVSEVITGSSTLTLTTNDPAGPCSPVTDQMVITINPVAIVSAGPDQVICTDSPTTTAIMAGSFGGGATSATWSTTGGGSFNNNSPSAIYTASNSDIFAGSVILSYTTNDPSGPCGPTSRSMTLTIRKRVLITTQPANTGICASSPADLNVVASGDGLTYQWYKGTAPNGLPVSNSATITGAQSPNLHFIQASLTDDGSYYVVVSGASPCAQITSQQATLNVDQSISIITQPASQTLCIGANVTFNVVADANGDPLAYQWRKNGTNIPGANSSAYTINNIIITDAGNYDVIISGQAGYTCASRQSGVAPLFVTPNVGIPAFVSGATSTRCQGAVSITYTANASNSTAITYSLDAASLAGGNTIIATTGAVTYSAGWSGITTITASAAGCNGPATSMHVVSITPSVTIIPFSPATSTRCQGSETVTATTTAINSTGITYSLDAASLAGGNTIVAATGAVTYVSGWSGTSIITASAAGCNGPATTTLVVSITPTVTIAAFSPATSIRCQGAGTVTTTTTATNSTGISYSLDAASIAGGNTIVAATGAVTYVAGWRGTTTITASAAGCNGPATTSHIVTITPTVSIEPFAPVTSVRCQAAGTITYTTTAANSTGITYSLDAASLAAGNTINSATGAVNYSAGWSGTTTITASAAGCNGPATANHLVTVYPLSVGGTITPLTTLVCHGTPQPNLALSGNTGPVVRWESSTDGGLSWIPISNINNSYTPTLTQSAMYRAVVQSGSCSESPSQSAVVSYISEYAPTITPPSPVICAGNSVTLTANSNVGSIGIPGMSFSNAGNELNGWCIDGIHCSQNDWSASKDNNSPCNWGLANHMEFPLGSGRDYVSPSPMFAIANGPCTSSITTPSFSLIGQISAGLNLDQAYFLTNGASASIQISVNGGAFVDLVTYITSSGPGTYNNFLHNSIDLTRYVGLSNIRIRFNYIGSSESAWGIDNLSITTFPGNPLPPINYVWTGAGLNTTSGSTVIATPPALGNNIYTVSTSISGCSLGSATATVFVNPLPVCSITGTNGPVCPSSVNIFSAPAGMRTYVWSISGNGSIRSGQNSQNITITSGTNCNAPFTLTLTITDNNGCVSICTKTVNVIDNVAPSIICPSVSAQYKMNTGLSYYTAVGTEFDATATDNCTLTSVTHNLLYSSSTSLAGYHFPLGSTTVIWTATDACGLKTTCQVSVVVIDDQPPVITCPPTINVQCASQVPAPYLNYAAFVAAGGIATDNNQINPALFTLLGSGVISNQTCPNRYTLTRTYQITDLSGNSATCSQVIIVNDQTAPAITGCPAGQTFCKTSDNSYTIPATINATDNCAGAVNISFQITGATIRTGTGNDASGTFNVGNSTITWSAEDACGNNSTCTTNITINPLPVTSPIYHR